jgi:hypothetical protein
LLLLKLEIAVETQGYLFIDQLLKNGEITSENLAFEVKFEQGEACQCQQHKTIINASPQCQMMFI